MSMIKTYLERRTKERLRKSEQERNAIRSAFTNRYLNFKTLLGLNDRVLGIISEMEQAAEGSRRFGMAFVRAQCTALSVNIFKIIESLNQITNQRDHVLFEVFDEVWAAIDRELKIRHERLTGPL